MPMNRVQFQPGLSMEEFLERYGTEEKCEAALVARRWPQGFVCPRCRHAQARTSFVREGRRYWQCAACQHQCSVTSGTMFEASKLPLRCGFLAMQLLTQSKNNVSALELKRHLGVCYRTAWLLKHKILEGMRLAEAKRPLTGRVEIDDAYLGGERSGGKAGRGSRPRGHRRRQGQCPEGEVQGGQPPHRQRQGRAHWHLHSIKFAKYAYRYLAEAQFRFNRRYDLKAILRSLLTSLVRGPRRPQRAIRVAEVRR